MPDSSRKPSPAKAAVAAARVRGEHGHFIKQSSRQSSRSAQAINIEENTSVDDKTLIDVKLTNPLRRITSILEQIRRRQATVIDLKFTVPLVALPLFMLAAFSLGKGSSGVCGENVQTRIGVIYTLKSTSETSSNGLFEMTKKVVFNNFPFLSSLTTNVQRPASPVGGPTTNRTILIQRDNSTLTVLLPQNLTLTPYHSRQAFVTGEVNSCEQTMKIANEDSVQLLP